jgi:hypothetical protein
MKALLAICLYLAINWSSCEGDVGCEYHGKKVGKGSVFRDREEGVRVECLPFLEEISHKQLRPPKGEEVLVNHDHVRHGSFGYEERRSYNEKHKRNEMRGKLIPVTCFNSWDVEKNVGDWWLDEKHQFFWECQKVNNKHVPGQKLKTTPTDCFWMGVEYDLVGVPVGCFRTWGGKVRVCELRGRGLIQKATLPNTSHILTELEKRGLREC